MIHKLRELINKHEQPRDVWLKHYMSREYIKLPDMTEGFYLCRGRSYIYAWWDGERFAGIRFKGREFVDYEEHYDTGSFGTVKPYCKLGE